MIQRWWMHFPLCPWGWRQGVARPKALHITATWRGNPSFVMVPLAVAVAIAPSLLLSSTLLPLLLPSPSLLPSPLPLPSFFAVAIAVAIAVAVAVAIAHRRHRCHRPLPLQLPSTIAAAISAALPSAIAVTITLAIGHCHLCHHQPLQLPLPSAITIAMPLAISESCCLGMARIVFNQLKQRMLTLFYFVRAVSGTLIEAEWLTRCWAAMANTNVGRQAVSSEQLVREVAGSRGAVGEQKGGDVDWPLKVLFCLVVGVSAIYRWHLWWCVGFGRRHCRDSDWTDARRK